MFVIRRFGSPNLQLHILGWNPSVCRALISMGGGVAGLLAQWSGLIIIAAALARPGVEAPNQRVYQSHYGRWKP